MTRLLFDTTFLIDAERNSDELEAVLNDDDDVAVAAVTIAELRVGYSPAEDDKVRARRTSTTSSQPCRYWAMASKLPRPTRNYSSLCEPRESHAGRTI
jgi:hypothetical protein